MNGQALLPFPPGRGHVAVPTGSRRRACAGLALYGPCRPAVVAAVHAAWLVTAVAGPRVLPGRPRPWTPPMPPETWSGLTSRWSEALGPFDAFAAHGRVQRSRGGFAVLLLRRDRPAAFVKVRRDGADALDREERALRAVAASPARGWSAPHPLAHGTVDGWAWVAATPLPPRPHRPAPRRTDIATVAAELQRALADLDRPPQAPAHWRPMHGDLTPWNLRRVAGSLWLIDWEETGWGPPSADVVYHAASSAALGRARVRAGWDPEAVRFWEDVVSARPADDADAALRRRLLRALVAMRGGASSG